uniref:Uncharacterized protein n=1 Tax=Arundo donax TaxID=35708 RepID=A0A0A9CDL7_ARUDO
MEQHRRSQEKERKLQQVLNSKLSFLLLSSKRTWHHLLLPPSIQEVSPYLLIPQAMPWAAGLFLTQVRSPLHLTTSLLVLWVPSKESSFQNRSVVQWNNQQDKPKVQVCTLWQQLGTKKMYGATYPQSQETSYLHKLKRSLLQLQLLLKQQLLLQRQLQKLPRWRQRLHCRRK